MHNEYFTHKIRNYVNEQSTAATFGELFALKVRVLADNAIYATYFPIATLSAFCVGQCLSWSSSAMPLLERSDSGLKVTKEEASWMVSLIALGALAGAIPAGSVSNMFGPKRVLLLSSATTLTSWILIAFGYVT